MVVSRVLVTRPEPGASATARLLREMGHEPVLLPLTRIEPLAADRWPEACDAVLATSANAIRHAPQTQLRKLASTPLFVVGERTAEAARAAGFSTIRAVAADAASLVGLVGSEIEGHLRFLYLAGAERGHVLEDGLRELGHAVDAVATYDAPAIAYPVVALSRMLGSERLDVALLYSSRAAVLLAQLAGRPEIAQLLAATRFLTISQEVSTALGSLGAGRALAAATPDEEGLLALLPAA